MVDADVVDDSPAEPASPLSLLPPSLLVELASLVELEEPMPDGSYDPIWSSPGAVQAVIARARARAEARDIAPQYQTPASLTSVGRASPHRRAIRLRSLPSPHAFATRRHACLVMGEGPRLPAPRTGQVRINLVSPAGLHFGQAPYQALAADPLAQQTMRAALALMQALVARSPRRGH